MVLALLASLSLFFLDTRLDYFKPARSALSFVVYPIQRIASLPSDMTNWVGALFQDRDELREEITVLKTNNLFQSLRLQKMQSMEQENMRLRELLGSSFRLQERVQIAELLTIDLDPFSQQVVIDKGKNYGVYEGQPVLDTAGVMGQVTEVSLISSRVTLLTDPSHSIPVQINRNGLRAVVTGHGLGESLKLDFIPRHADVRVGDLLVTSGLGERFPPGYPVGKVLTVNILEGEAFVDIDVVPQANISTSREVMLVLPGEKILVAPVPETEEEQVAPEQEDSDNG